MGFFRCFRKKNCHSEEAVARKLAKKELKEKARKEKEDEKNKKQLLDFEKNRKKEERKIKTA